MGTNISAYLSMILLRESFLCLLRINFWVLLVVFMSLKAKRDHFHHECTNGFATAWWKWSRRAFSLFTVYQILSAEFIENSTWQSCYSKLQYNTCRSRAKQFSVLGYLIVLTTCLSSLGMRLTTCFARCVSSLFSIHFFSDGEVIFEQFYRLKIRPHINHSVLGFDHIFDHKQNRSTRR